MDKALAEAKTIQRLSKDVEVNSRNLEFSCNGGIFVKTKGAASIGSARLLPQAVSQVSDLLRVPLPWIQVKRELKDPEDLADSLNRHVKRLPSQGFLMRYFMERQDNGKYQRVLRAVFPDNTATLDIVETLGHIQAVLGSRITQWPFICIEDFSLRAFGLITSPKIKELRENKPDALAKLGILPGVHVYTSEDGSFPKGCDLGIYRGLCKNAGILMEEQFRGRRLRGVEKQEGNLGQRFRTILEEVKKTGYPSFMHTLKRLTVLAETETGPNLKDAVEQTVSMTKLSRSHVTPILAAWAPNENNCFGIWNAMTRYADVETKNGHLKTGYELGRAAGRLQTLSNYQLNHIQVVSNQK